MSKVNKKYLSLVLPLTTSLVFAGSINDLSVDNITTDSGPYTLDETYFSVIYTDDTKTNSNGAISWTESDVMAPGISVVNDDSVNMTNCVMTSGINPNDASIKQCSDPFQTSKRIKMNATAAGKEIDMVFNVGDIAIGSRAYRILEKYLNVTNFAISDFKIELGFGTAENFIKAVEGIGLDFSDNVGNILVGDIVTGDVNSLNLDALFPFGLFGDATSDPNHDIDGYFDPTARARFTLKANRGGIESTGITANYFDLVGHFLSKSQVLEGIFFDHDNDINTDSITIAHQIESGWISFRTDQFWIDIGSTSPPLNIDGTIVDSTIMDWLSDPLYSTGPIEDLANLNLNYHLTVGDITLWPTYDMNAETANFTLRISSKSVIFANGFELPVL